MKIFKRCFFVTIILFAIANLLNFTFAQNKPAAPKLEPQVQQIAGMNAELLSGGENEKQLAHSLKWRLNQWDDKQRKEWNETVKHA
ncbi:MAG: hypothetical protein LBP59_14990, partial [Planctomycetaceae bacterium]|nr:hypothetical protein [Planctomycetaceae bacterium]